MRLECFDCEKCFEGAWDEHECGKCKGIICRECETSCDECKKEAEDSDGEFNSDPIFCTYCRTEEESCKNCRHIEWVLLCKYHMKQHLKQCKPRTVPGRALDICNKAIRRKSEDIQTLQERLTKYHYDLSVLRTEQARIQAVVRDQRENPKKRNADDETLMGCLGKANDVLWN